MLYLGVLDDKTTEYPFLDVEGAPGFSNSYLIYHCLFNPAIILEEGFLLASKEAMSPRAESPILLRAVQAGLVKVASRHNDLIHYVSERKSVGHPVPPDDRWGAKYVNDLQTICGARKAFCIYGPEALDRLTFDRFVVILENDLSKMIGKENWPAEFIDKFAYNYAHGNRGGQWTARSALEKTAKDLFPGRPNHVSAIMVAANRERQILRGAAIAYYNRLDDVHVETGYTSIHNNLAREDASLPKAVESLYDHRDELFPSLNFSVLTKKHKLLFEAFGEDDGSYLQEAKASYIKRKQQYLAHGTDKHFSDLKHAAQTYEGLILDAIGEHKVRDSLLGQGVKFGAGTFVNIGIGAVGCAIDRKLRSDVHRNIYTRLPLIEHEVTRRTVLWGAILGFAGAFNVINFTAGNALGDYACDSLEHELNEAFQTNPIKALNGKEIIYRPKAAHHRFKVDSNKAASLLATLK